MPPDYRCILTAAGAAMEARAKLTGEAVRLTHLAVGDGADTVPDPDPDATGLVRELHRRPIDALSQDKDNPHVLWTSTLLPADVGGWWIREVGLYSADPDHPDDPAAAILYGVGNHAPYYKTLSRDGQATEHEICVPVVVSSAGTVEIVVKSSGYATQSALNTSMAAQLALAQEVIRLTGRATDAELELTRLDAYPAMLLHLTNTVIQLSDRLTRLETGGGGEGGAGGPVYRPDGSYSGPVAVGEDLAAIGTAGLLIKLAPVK